MLSRNAKSFQRKSGRESSMKGTRSRKTPATAFALQPTSHPFVLIHSFPLGTFNGIKLWACESNNNHLGLKHNTLTGLTRPLSPPLLARRRGHLLLLLRNRAHWLSHVTSSVINRWRAECRLTRCKNISFKIQKSASKDIPGMVTGENRGEFVSTQMLHMQKCLHEHKLDHYFIAIKWTRTLAGHVGLASSISPTCSDPGTLLYDICTWRHAAFSALLSDWLKMTCYTSLAPQDALPVLTGPLKQKPRYPLCS